MKVVEKAQQVFNELRPKAIDDPVFALRSALIFVTMFAFTRGCRYTFGAEPVPMGIQLISGDDGSNGAFYWGIAWFVAAAIALVGIPKAWPLVSLGVVALSLAFAYGFTSSWLRSPVGSPGRADYANAGTYWFAIGMLGFGYILARRALKGTSSTSEE